MPREDYTSRACSADTTLDLQMRIIRIMDCLNRQRHRTDVCRTGSAVFPRRDSTSVRQSSHSLRRHGVPHAPTRLIDTVWCLTGGGRRPPKEIIAQGLSAASAEGKILATESWIRSILFFYTLTPKGAKEFRRLNGAASPRLGRPNLRAAATIKFGLLDMPEPEDLPAVIADLKRFYLNVRRGLQEREENLAHDRPFLQAAMADRLG